MNLKDDSNIMLLAYKLLDEACDANRHRDAEIMQGIDGEKEHAKTVLLWTKKLTSNPSTALKIAALFHDIDRIVTPNVGSGFKGDRKSKAYQEHKKAHAKRSADYIYDILLKNDIEPHLVERIRFLILHHDDGGAEVESLGDDELNVLVGADTLSFFTSIAPKLYKAEGAQELKDKIRFMIEKAPHFVRELLLSHHLENSTFEKLKNEALEENKCKQL